MLVKVIFSLMGLMGLYLVSIGLRFLTKDPHFKPLYWFPSDSYHLIIGSILLIFGQILFIKTTLTYLLWSTAVIFLLVILLRHFKWISFYFPLILSLIWGANIIEIAT